MRKDEQENETTNAANSTIGKANSFHGSHRSRASDLIGFGFDWKIFHCFLDGYPLPRWGSRAAVSVWERSGMVPRVSVVVSLSSVRSSWTFSWEAEGEALPCEAEAFWAISSG